MGAGSSSKEDSGISDAEHQGAQDTPGSRTNNTAATENVPQEINHEPACFFKYINAIARLWGILLFVGVWGCMVESFRREYKYSPYYLLGVAVLVTFLEVVWLLNKCVVACCREDGCGRGRVWKAVVWVDDWKKAILYILLSIPCFTQPLRNLMPLLAAGLLIAAAVLYFIKSFHDSSCRKSPPDDQRDEDTTDPKARLVATEQRQYDTVASTDVTSRYVTSQQVSSSGNGRQVSMASSRNAQHSPVTPSDTERCGTENEKVPVGYNHKYELSKTTSSVTTQRPRSTNPFDAGDGTTHGIHMLGTSADNVHRYSSPENHSSDPEEVPVGYKHGSPRGTAMERPRSSHQERSRSTNPFDEDKEDAADSPSSFEHKLQRPPSTNPFDSEESKPRPSSTNPFDE